MGVLGTVVSGLALVGVAVYVGGRSGAVRFARLAGEVMGSSVARARASRGRLQKQLVDTQSPQQAEQALQLQRNMWRARMIVNEVAMVRNLSPRLLYRGNFGFTTTEMLDALGQASSVHRAVAAPMAAQALDQMRMEGQALSDPSIFPLSGTSERQAPRPRAADPAMPHADLTPTSTQSSAPGVVSASQPSTASFGSATSTGPADAAGFDAASIDQLDPTLRQFHWTNIDSAPVDPTTGFVITSSRRMVSSASATGDPRR